MEASGNEALFCFESDKSMRRPCPLVGCSSFFNPRPRKFLANRPQYILGDFLTLQYRVLPSQLPADDTARLAHRTNDAIQRRIGTLHDALQPRSRRAMPRQTLSLSSHFLLDG